MSEYLDIIFDKNKINKSKNQDNSLHTFLKIKTKEDIILKMQMQLLSVPEKNKKTKK